MSPKLETSSTSESSKTTSQYQSYSLDSDTHKIVVDKSLSFLYDPDNHPPLSITETVYSLFNTTTLVMLIGFLAIYYILYFLLGKVYKPFTPLNKIKGLTINFTCLLLLLFGGLYFYYSLPENNQKNFIHYVSLLFKDEMNNPNTVFIMIEFLLIFYAIVYAMGLPMGEKEKPFSLHIIELKSWIYLAMLIIIMFFIYILHIEIVDLCYYEWFRLLDSVNKYSSDEDVIKSSPTPAPKPIPTKIPISVPIKAPINKLVTSPSAAPTAAPSKAKTTEPTCPSEQSNIKDGNKEVFNVSNNLYTYDDAQAICKAEGARLATYDEIEEAYEAGAEWCNYGWSEGQMAYFPTQKKTWEQLQKDPNTKHKCGRPGVNGGFINNPNIKFGVNCYGVKPPPNDMEKNMMDANKHKLPKCPAAAPIDPNVEKWKKQLDKLVINSYNNTEWSQYS
jgi:hypothetical protein